MASFRSYVWLVTVFAVTATMLAGIGTYGVTAYAVSLRVREIGVRRALGAGRRDIFVLVTRHALGWLATGLTLGIGGALMLTRLIQSQLWGITPTDPVTFVGASVVLAGVALVATVIPTRRAVAVDPAIALRGD